MFNLNIYQWIQFLLFLLLLFALTPLIGKHLYNILQYDRRNFLSPILGPVEKLLYRFTKTHPDREQNWKEYGLSLGIFTLIGMILTYLILRLQGYLPFHPSHLGPVKDHLAFNTAASFASNTNWQSYAGETTMSYFSQAVALTFQNFVSAAAGIAVCAALVRGIVRKTAKTVGNFKVDLIRVTLYLLLPFSFVFAIFFVSQGVIQDFKGPEKVLTLESTPGNPQFQTIPRGPVASQEAIKILGTNGGGFFNANSSHPYENPTPLTNFIQVLMIFLIPSGLTRYLGLMAHNKKHGWAIWFTMTILFTAGFLISMYAESSGNPLMQKCHIIQSPNMEGKEVRFGVFGSSLYSVATTDASCGAVNSMHDSYTPLGGLVTLVNIQLGEIVFGGVGSGLYGMLIFVIIAIFLAGLMVGRTPEYLGKKIDSHEVRLCVLIILITALFTLGPAAWAVSTKWGVAAAGNKGPHGFSQILYAFTSAAGNNGSAFAGLSTNNSIYNVLMGIVMLAGRFFVIVPVLALAGSLARKKTVPPGPSSFPVNGFTFILLLLGVIIIVGMLTFLPALAFGPIAEHFIMLQNSTLF